MRRIQNKGKARVTCFHPKDADAFSDALRERWPGITFQRHAYWELQEKGHSAYKENWKDIDEYPSLGATDEGMIRVFVKPDGWEPVWTDGPNESGLHFIENLPEMDFIYQSSIFIGKNGMRAWGDDPKFSISSGRLSIIYNKDNKEHERFLNAVWRIVAKLSTNIVDILDMETGEVRHHAQRTTTWCGYHALDWCREDPRRRLDENLRPAD